MKRLLLCGEGRNELGSWSGDPAYQSASEPGVLEALLRKVKIDGWEITQALQWKDIRKLRPGGHRSAESRNVGGAALRARESGCDGLVFSRDRDAREERERELEEAIAEAGKTIPVAAATAVEKLEGWMRALAGEDGSENRKHPEAGLAEDLKLDGTSTGHLVALIERTNLNRLPDDATSLRRFLERAKALLGS